MTHPTTDEPVPDAPEAEDEATDETEPEMAPVNPARSRNPLSRDGDFVARPGFRNPANKRSKASTKKKKKKKGGRR